MNHQGYFLSQKGNKYYVLIQTPGTGGNSLEFSETPLTIKYDSDGDVYKPLRLSKASLSLESDDILLDIFSTTANQVKMFFRNEQGGILWEGYLKPNSYDQEYLGTVAPISLEFADPIDVLEYYKYKTYNKGMLSVLDTIVKAIKSSGYTLSTMYVHNFTDKKLSEIYINESNWFDEDGDGMECREVLEEILRYYGLTMFYRAGAVYIVDYDLLKSGDYSFHKLVSSNNFAYGSTVTNLPVLMEMSGQTIYEGSSVSRTATTDKVSIRASLYSKDQHIPDPTIINNLAPIDGETKEMGAKDGYTYIIQNLTSKEWEQYYYTQVSNTGFTPSATATDIGGIFQRVLRYKEADGRPARNNWEYMLSTKYTTGSKSNTQYNLNSPLISYHNPNYASYSNINFGIYMDMMFTSYKRTEEAEVAEFATSDNVSVQCEFRIGAKYWTGEYWSSTKCTFPIRFNPSKDNRCYSYKWLSAKDTNSYLNNTPDIKGHVIKVVEPMCGDVSVIIYSPSVWSSYTLFPNRALIKNIEFTQQTPNGNEEDTDTDTVYEGMLDENSVEKMDDIELKVTTYTDKGMSYSAVMNKTMDGNFNYLKTQYCRALNQTKIQEYNLLDRYLKQYGRASLSMMHEVDGIVVPNTIITDINFPDMKFMIDTVEYDYGKETSTVNIIEI